MANVINVSACDNELILIAYPMGGPSFEICRILSGLGYGVNLTINIISGQFSGTQTLDGTNVALDQALDISLAPGSYSLLLIGINWGGPFSFNVGFNDQTFQPVPLSGELGVVWTPDPISMTV